MQGIHEQNLISVDIEVKLSDLPLLSYLLFRTELFSGVAKNLFVQVYIWASRSTWTLWVSQENGSKHWLV